MYSSSDLRLSVLQLCLGLFCTLFSFFCLFVLCRSAGACLISALGAWVGSSLCGASVYALAPLFAWCAPVPLSFLFALFFCLFCWSPSCGSSFSCRWFVLSLSLFLLSCSLAPCCAADWSLGIHGELDIDEINSHEHN